MGLTHWTCGLFITVFMAWACLRDREVRGKGGDIFDGCVRFSEVGLYPLKLFCEGKCVISELLLQCDERLSGLISFSFIPAL